MRLLADVAVLEGGHADKKRFIMNGLQRLGRCGRLALVNDTCRSSNPNADLRRIDARWLTDRQLTGWLQASQTPGCPPPEDAPLTDIAHHAKHFTRTRQQVVSDADWYSHPAVIKHRLGVGIDHFLYSVYPLHAPDVWSAIGFISPVRQVTIYRRTGKDGTRATE